MESRFWWKRWRKVSWLQRLCGAMPEPSTADAGVASWMASLGASPASPTPRPAGAAARRTSANFGPPPGEPSSSLGPGGHGSKTSAACSPPEAPPASIETFGALVGRLKSDFSRRQNAARHRSESGYSSSRWTTPVAADSGEKVTLATTQHACLLREAVLWNAPTVASSTGGQRNRGGDRQDELLLAGQAIAASSLLGPMISPAGSNTSPSALTLNPRFCEALMAWPTGLTRSECSATELCQFKERMRFVISQLPLPSRAPPQQRDLFS